MQGKKSRVSSFQEEVVQKIKGEKKMAIRQNQIIEFTLDNTESIREGMKRYQDLLQRDLVNTGCEMDVLFTYREDGVLKPLQAYHGEEGYLKELERVSMEAYTSREGTFESVTSEAIFFSHALKYEELLEEVVNTAQEIVNYARRHNDTWKMWADDMGVFGLDALYLLAKKYPEYTYLIGGFMIPYWDDEHADYAFRYLYQLCMDNGFTDHIMKAFCYCDNDQARLSIIGISYYINSETYFQLGRYLEENPSKYKLFKEMLKERFKEQKFLQYSSNDYTDRPVQKIYGVIMVSSNREIGLYEDEDDYVKGLEKTFIEDSYDNESFELQQEIEEALGCPLVGKREDEDEEVSEDEVWRDFFINGFEDGNRIWNYIMSGEGEEVLHNIEPTDIKVFSKEKGLLFYQEKIKWFVGEYDTVEEEFHRIFEGFMIEYYEEQEGDFRVVINGLDVSGRERVVRALDLFYRLLGKSAFTNELFNLVRSYGVMTTDEFTERYDLNRGPSIGHLSSLLSDPMAYVQYSTRDDIDRIHKYMNSDRERARILFTGRTAKHIEDGTEEKVLLRGDISGQRDVQVKLLEEGLIPDTKVISVIIYLLEREYNLGRSDELTKVLIDYIENNWLDLILSILEEGSNLTKDDLEKIKIHIAGRPAPPKELFMKALTQGRDALTEEERALLNPNAGGSSLEEAAELLNEKLKRSRKGKKYKIFNRMVDYSLTDIIPALYFGGFRLNLRSSGQMQKALKLLSAIAPAKVMTVIYDMCHAQIKRYTTYDFRMDMKKLSQTDVLALAIEINRACDEDYQPYVDLYIEADDEPSGGMIKSFSKKEFNEALSYLEAHERESFFKEVSQKCPEEVDYLEEFIKNLRGFVEDNLKKDLYKGGKDIKKRLEDVTYNLLEDYIMGADNLSEVLANFDDYIGASETLRKLLWKIDDAYRDRFLKLLIEKGSKGIDAGISNRIIDEGYVEMWDFLEKISDLGTSMEVLVEWGIEWGVEDALIIANRKEEIYPFVKTLTINEREEALNLSKNSPEMIRFIWEMTGDTSARISKQARKIREQII